MVRNQPIKTTEARALPGVTTTTTAAAPVSAPSLDRLRECAALCAEAYGPVTASGAGDLGCAPFACARTDTQGFVRWSPETVHVVFRGTESIRDWLTDLRVGLLDGGRYGLHTGFSQATGSVLPLVAALVRPLLTGGRSLVLTGHSLGGALAVLVAFGLAEAGLDVTHVITFGQPRVGDARFAASYQQCLGDRTCRVVNDLDVVPRSPGVLFGYRHAVSSVLFFDGQGRPWCDPSWGRRLRSDVRSCLHDLEQRAAGVVGDHGINRYVQALAPVTGTWPALEKGAYAG